MKTSGRLQDVLAIVCTPFHDDDSIDYPSIQRQVDWVFHVGAHGLGTGMVSEILRLSPDERKAITQQLVHDAAGRGPVFASVGAESIPLAADYARHAQQAGCAAVMAVPPVTAPVSPQQLLTYYRSIADAVDLPVVVQDASNYVGQSIPLAVSIELLRQYGPDKLLFKPEASPIGPNLTILRDATQGTARIFEGSGGAFLVDCYRRGVAGTMPGVDLLDAVVQLWQALKTGDDERAYRIYYPLCALVNLQMQSGLDGFLSIEKYLLVKRGVFNAAHRRGPFEFELDQETASEVDRLFERLQAVL